MRRALAQFFPAQSLAFLALAFLVINPMSLRYCRPPDLWMLRKIRCGRSCSRTLSFALNLANAHGMSHRRNYQISQ
jgi:hypothetical protein